MNGVEICFVAAAHAMPTVVTGIAAGVAALSAVRVEQERTKQSRGQTSPCDCTVATTLFPISLKVGQAANITVKVHVGTPDATGCFEKPVTLLVNRSGVVPPLIVRATVLDRPTEKSIPK